MSASHAVVLDGVSFRYLDEAELAAQERPEESHESCVRGVKLDIPVGTCTILCGRSGDGKSTVLRLIDGLAGTFFPGERKGAVLVGGADVLAFRLGNVPKAWALSCRTQGANSSWGPSPMR